MAAVAPDVRALVEKYARLLGANGEVDLKVRDNLGSRWLGRTTWSPRRPTVTVIELQRRVLGDPRTLERVLAHEMVHHWELTHLSDSDRALLQVGFRPAEHGPTFRRGAAIVNAAMGDGFVTEKSDEEYVQAPSGRRFWVLIEPIHGGRLGWQWSARLSPQARAWADAQAVGDARLVETDDERWTRGVRMKRYAGWSLPKGEDVEALRRLYDGR